MVNNGVFGNNVFINCPFDADYQPLLHGILYCAMYLGFNPRIATERADSAENRLAKIVGLIRESKYSIHDLSRSQARRKGEHYRLNMPFELGIDYGSRQFGGTEFAEKSILVLEEKSYATQRALSDLAGCDVQSHGGDVAKAVLKVRNWFATQSSAKIDGAELIVAKFTEFETALYEQLKARGFSDDEVRNHQTAERLEAMRQWFIDDEHG